ncbi:MAG: CRISPR-associated protein Cas4 [Bacteroidota bacterium]
MRITGTHFNYYFICQRKLWLFARGIQMEHTSDLVLEGKLIHETSYPQRSGRYQEIELEGIKVDYFDARNKVIHEIKKSDKLEEAHQWQLKYYIYVMENNGIEGVHGILEYPALRKTEQIYLSSLDKQQIEDFLYDIREIMDSDLCPGKVRIPACKNCSYHDFCWVEEEAGV